MKNAIRRAKKRHLAPIAAFLPVLALALAWARRWSGSLGGDPFAVYIPTARRILEGHLLDGYGAMVLGIGRLPGYPIALALSGLFFDDLFLAAKVLGFAGATVGLLAAAWVFRRLGASWSVLCGAGLAVVGTATWMRSTSEVLPDMVSCGVFYGAVVAGTLALEDRRRWPLFLCGALAGLGFMLRLNYIALAALGPYLVLERALLRRTVLVVVADALGFLSGFLAALAPLVPIVWRMRSLGFDFPHIVMRTEGGDGVTGAVAAIPAGLADIPTRVVALVPWWFAALAAVGGVALLVRNRESARRRALGPTAVAALAMIVALGPIHFEERYYVWLLPLVAGAAVSLPAAVAARIDGRVVAPVSLALGALVAWMSAPQAEALASKAEAIHDATAQACRQLDVWSAAAAQEEIVVGSSWRGATYTQLTACAHRAGPRRIHIVGAVPERDVGVRYWFSFRPTGLVAPAGATKVLDNSHYEMWTTTTTTALRIQPGPGEPLEFDSDYPSRRCFRRRVELEPGRLHVIQVQAEVVGEVVARLFVGVEGTKPRCFGVGNVDLIVRVVSQAGGAVPLEVCPADPAASGRIRLRSIRVVPEL